MNRIETKIIVMLTNTLAAAKDSEAKTELIEELSENLYQRYLDLTAAGVPEQEALNQAMDSLGDVQELLAYLGEEETQELVLDQKVSWERNSYDQGTSDRKEEQGNSSEKDWSQAFDTDKFERGIEDLVGMAMSAAKGAVELASDVTRNVSESLSKELKQFEFHGNGQSANTSRRRGNEEHWMIPCEAIRSLDISLYHGDIRLTTDPMATAVIVNGDLDQLEYMFNENGMLNIRQRSVGRGGGLFSRCIVADMDITIPRKQWDRLGVQTSSGDIFVGGGLLCEALYLHTKSGDITLEGGAYGIVAQKVAVRTLSGDVDASGLAGSLYVNSTSGDVTVESCDLQSCGAISSSGDIYVECKAKEVNCSSTSGDVELTFTDHAPASVKAATTSGDLRLELCGGEGFTLGYRTISGDVSYDLPDTGQWAEQRESGKKGAILYRSGEPAKVQLSTVSGDIDMTLEA